MNRVVSIASVAVSLVVMVASPAAAWDDGYWFLEFKSSSAPAHPLRVGVDEGGGFGFVTYTDDDGDGAIQFGPIPVGSRLALGVNQAAVDPACQLWDISGSSVQGGVIEYPLFTNALDDASLGIDFGELTAPPLLLTPGDRFTVVAGVLPAWPSLRFVDESGVPGLETFVQVVDTLPAFNGDVIVSNASLRFTFVPEPTSLMLLMLAAAGLSLPLRRRVWRFQKPVCA